MRWWHAEAEIRPDGTKRLKPGHFRFDVVVNPFADSAPHRLDVPDENQHALKLLKKAQKYLDEFAFHPLYVPAFKDRDELVGLEWLVQLVIRAAKSGHLRVKASGRDKLQVEACEAFRQYACRLNVKSLDRLSIEERTAATDAVFRRLVMSGFGHGFLAPSSSYAFRSYVRRTLRFSAKDIQVKERNLLIRGSGKYRSGRQMLDDGQDIDLDGGLVDAAVPRGIVDAGERLEVSASTVWRHMQKHGYSTLTREAWEQVQVEIKGKAAWQAIERWLLARGVTRFAARKRISRWKRAGNVPTDIVRRLLTGHGVS